MKTPATVANQVLSWLASLRSGTAITTAPMTPEQGEVADWLKGDVAKCESLRNLLLRRIEDRGLLPVPSNPHEVFVVAGRDAEARELARLLLLLCTSPVQPFGSGEDDVGNRELRPGSQ